MLYAIVAVICLAIGFWLGKSVKLKAIEAEVASFEKSKVEQVRSFAAAVRRHL